MNQYKNRTDTSVPNHYKGRTDTSVPNNASRQQYLEQQLELLRAEKQQQSMTLQFNNGMLYKIHNLFC